MEGTFEYDGWRRGISGLGGAGVPRGNLVSFETPGLDGDLSDAATNSFASSLDGLVVASSCCFRRLLSTSSLCSLIRIDLLAGGQFRRRLLRMKTSNARH